MVKFWNKDALRGTGIILVSLIMGIVSPITVYAGKLSESQMTMFAQNDIMFYDPNGGLNNRSFNPCDPDSMFDNENDFDNSESGGGGGGGVSSAAATDFIEKWHDLAVEYSIKYGIPWETAIAQSMLESGYGTSYNATHRHNFHGLGRHNVYPSDEDGWRAYFQWFANNPRYPAHGVFSGDAITDPWTFLRAITDANYETADYYNLVTPYLNKVLEYAKEKGWKTSAELAEEHPEMLENAAKNATGGGGSGSGSSSSGGGEGSDSEEISNDCSNDINALAIELSWPDRTHDPKDPKPEYKDALAQVGLDKYPDPDHNVQDGNSCDAFVATVMRASGADPNFQCCGAEPILNYLLGHPEMYEEIDNLGNTSNLQGGDIRASEKHVEMVVQMSDGSFKIASASNPDRTADHYDNYYPGPQYRIFRRK